jgi:hypothetical protein
VLVDELDDAAEREGQDRAGMTMRGLALPQLPVSLLDGGRSHRDLRSGRTGLQGTVSARLQARSTSALVCAASAFGDPGRAQRLAALTPPLMFAGAVS